MSDSASTKNDAAARSAVAASASHTPGPWEWAGSYLYGANFKEIITDSFFAGHQDISVRGADKPLIAAAPDLLAACEAGFNALQEECFAIAARRPGAMYETPGAKVLDQMRAAIKKAKGQS